MGEESGICLYRIDDIVMSSKRFFKGIIESNDMLGNRPFCGISVHKLCVRISCRRM